MHLAQFNIAEALAADDSPVMADFFANIDCINAVADNAPGFIWRLTDDGGEASSSIRIECSANTSSELKTRVLQTPMGKKTLSILDPFTKST